MKMNDKLVVFIIAALFQVHLALSSNHSRIINGVLASAGQFPYQISLQQDGAHNCGGSILTENYVLTAAHCLAGSSPWQLQVIAGTIDLDNLQAPASVHRVSRILNHENYQEANSWNNDIAMLQITPPFQFNQHILPAKLPSRGSVIKDGALATISGFGRTWKNAPSSQRLLKTDVYIVNQTSCQKIQRAIRPTNLCTNNLYRVTGFCNVSLSKCAGDSGGPLTLDGTVVGIVSYAFNYGCAGYDQSPQVFTRVSEYIDWIANHIK